MNKGIAPVEAEDPEVAPMIARCVLEKKTLTATYTYDALISSNTPSPLALVFAHT